MLVAVETNNSILESLHFQNILDSINQPERDILDSDQEDIEKFEVYKTNQRFLKKKYKWAHISCINMTPNIKFCDDDLYDIEDSIQEHQIRQT